MITTSTAKIQQIILLYPVETEIQAHCSVSILCNQLCWDLLHILAQERKLHKKTRPTK